MGRNTVRRFLAVTALAILTFVAPEGTAHADTDNTAVDRYGACLAAQKAGELLILVDESGSLRETDGENARVTAAQYLVDTLGEYADRTGSDLQVSVAGFSESYVVHQDWTPLTADSAPAINATIDTLAEHNTGLDTDYWTALDGARQALAQQSGGDLDRCQAIAWFSDGELDFTQRTGNRPYATDVDLGTEAGVDEMVRRATDDICRDGGIADQLRATGVVMLGIGLGQEASDVDFDVMSAITTGTGLNGRACGSVLDPLPGGFYPVDDIDEMLFAFDALNPVPSVDDSRPVCQNAVCEEARHNFVLDASVKSVSILGSGGEPGIVPYLISPLGTQVELSEADGEQNLVIDDMPVTYEWQSESAQTVSITSDDNPNWVGQWAIVYVDTTGEHGDAVSRVSIHITTDIFPTLVIASDAPWRAGQVMEGVTFGLVDAQGNSIDPDGIAGEAVMSAELVADGVAPVEILSSTTKDHISSPVDVDLTDVEPGSVTVRMSLVITTADAVDPHGQPIAGTELSPQQVELPVQVLPKAGLPVPADGVDFGQFEGVAGAVATLQVTGPGCVWLEEGTPASVLAAPEGVGTVSVTSPSSSADTCLMVADGQTGSLELTLSSQYDGHGGLTGTVPLHIAPSENLGEDQTMNVTFTASMVRPLSTTNFLLVLLAALLLGPGIPLALLYFAKWRVGRIPAAPMLAQRIAVDVDSGVVLRDGQPFELADTDLVSPVPGLSHGARRLVVHGVHLSTVCGRSPFGAAHVRVTAAGYVSAGSDIPATDTSGRHAVLPLAVHGRWVVLHDPKGPHSRAEVVVMVSGQSDINSRKTLFEDIERRLPELLAGVRRHAAADGLATLGDQPSTPSPFAVSPAPDAQPDPFADTLSALLPQFDSHTEDIDPRMRRPAAVWSAGPDNPHRYPPRTHPDDRFDPFSGGY